MTSKFTTRKTIENELKLTFSEHHLPNTLISFDDITYDDPTALHSAQEALLREQWIHVNALKTCRRALMKCYKHHGVNHLEECKEISEKYLKYLEEGGRIKGFYGYQKNDPSKWLIRAQKSENW